MLESVPAWLLQDVPLWAFLLALLTSPARWSRAAATIMRDRFGGGGGS